MNGEFILRIIADGAVIPVVLVAGYLLTTKIPNDKKYQAYCRILMAGLTAYLFAKLIGSVYQPSYERPFELLGTSAGASYLDNPGFPSDHILFVTAIVCAVWFETKQKLATYILVFIIALIGIGRVLALVHSPIDVIGGVIIAITGTIWYFVPEKYFNN